MTNLSILPISAATLIGCSDIELKHRRLDQTDAEDANRILPRRRHKHYNGTQWVPGVGTDICRIDGYLATKNLWWCDQLVEPTTICCRLNPLS